MYLHNLLFYPTITISEVKFESKNEMELFISYQLELQVPDNSNEYYEINIMSIFK